ncbi:hypothetical protein F5Y06DRAFT_301492 [Hypoxylon sp. FL0890]|nr:hypothetical protein F5Y06DRAFT_301492 [Hypoxylon sp. FL0890]
MAVQFGALSRDEAKSYRTMTQLRPSTSICTLTSGGTHHHTTASAAGDVRDNEFAVYFDFSDNDYIGINHTFACDRGEEKTDPWNRFANPIATGSGRLPIGLVDTPEGHYTGTEGDT